MRLHRNLVIAVIKVLDGTFNHNFYADKTIEKILKSDKRWEVATEVLLPKQATKLSDGKRLYSQISETKSPYKYGELWKMFSFGLS